MKELKNVPKSRAGEEWDEEIVVRIKINVKTGAPQQHKCTSSGRARTLASYICHGNDGAGEF